MRKSLFWVVVILLSLLAWLSMYVFSSFEGIVFNPRGQLGAISGAGSNLIAHYSFDEGSGTIAGDTSGNNQFGTLVNGATWTAGKVGGAIQLDGVDDYVSLPTDTIFDFGTDQDFSISAWFKTSKRGGTNAVWPFSIVSKGFAITETKVMMAIIDYRDNHNFVAGILGPSSAGDIYPSWGLVMDERWHHSVLSVDRNGNASLYVDGVLQGSRGATNHIDLSTPGTAFRIGAAHQAGYPQVAGHFPGLIDQVMIYRQALSASDVAELYNGGAGKSIIAAADTTPPNISNVSTSRLATTATINWRTNEPADGQIEYGPTTSYGMTTALESGQRTSHSQALSNLLPDTTYFVKIKSKDAVGNIGEFTGNFKTRPAAGAVIVSGSDFPNQLPCSEDNVRAAIERSSFEGIVKIPAGPACTWTTSMVIDKPITLQGETTVDVKNKTFNDRTIIIDGVTRDKQGHPHFVTPQLIRIIAGSPALTRITGLTVKGGSIPDPYNAGVIVVYGDNFRLDNNHFIPTYTAAVKVNAEKGLIDHNYYDNTQGSAGVFNYVFDNRDWSGDAAWAKPLKMGSDEAIYIEDNYFKGNNGNSFGIDSWQGGKTVFRFNVLDGTAAGNHGLETSGRLRSGLNLEIYENKFDGNAYTAINYRGGTGIVFNNTVTNAASFGVLNNYRDTVAYGFWPNKEWGQCSGFSSFDKTDGIVHESGTHTGPVINGLEAWLSTPALLTDSSKDWSPNQWVGYSVHNLRTGRSGPVHSNTSNTITIGVDSTRAGPFVINPGDRYSIRLAYPCIDQIGRSSGDLITGGGNETPAAGAIDPLKPKAWPNQKLDPIYAWGNTFNGGVARFGAITPHAKEGRDYYDNACRPGYRPYTYPHPLTGLPRQTINLNCPDTPTVPQFNLQVNKTGGGTGTVAGTDINCGAHCSSRIDQGESVVLTAIPSSGSQFVSWNGGGCSGSSRTCRFTLNGDTVIGAQFAPDDNNVPPPVSGTDTDNDGILSPQDRCPHTPSHLRTTVNRQGCAKPKDSNFDIKPNFDNLDLAAVNNLELGKQGTGKIRWTGTVDLEREDTALDLDSHITIQRGKITVNSNTLPELNKPATITLYNITLKNPAFLKDGAICTGCQLVSYSNNTLVFTVPGFSTYEIVEGDGNTPPSSTPSSGASSRSTRSGSSSRKTVTCFKWAVYSPTTGERCTTFTPYKFTKDLTIGSRGEDVRQLQISLNNSGYPIASSGDGSKGRETTYFGPATRNALIKFQKAKKITPAAGYFGAKTRAQIK